MTRRNSHRLRTLISAFALLGLAACSSGAAENIVEEFLDDLVTIDTNPIDDPPEQVIPVDDPPDISEDFLTSGDGTLTGRVVSAIDTTPLAGVDVALFVNNGGTILTRSTLTNEAGEYVMDDLPRGVVYNFDITLDSFLAETFSEVIIDPNTATTELELEPIRLISADNAGLGDISGVIVNATTGNPEVGVTLEFFDGINITNGTLAATVITDADGSYSVTGLAAGNYTCVIFGDGLQTSIVTVFVIGNAIVTAQNGTISPIVLAGETRIVLTWGETPRDLDSHFTGPTIDGTDVFRVYFANRAEEDVILDTDDTSSFGPETVTISDSSRPGVFRYSVFNFSGGSASNLSNSGARVEVIREGGTVAEFFVPRGEGNLWSVFDMVRGQIQAIGTVTNRVSNDDYFAPETIALDSTGLTASRIDPTTK